MWARMRMLVTRYARVNDRPSPRRRQQPAWLLEVVAEERARDVEGPRAFHALRFGPAARVFADLHPERSGHIIQIGAIEEGVWQSVDQSERHLASRALQGLVQHDTLMMGDGAVGEAVHDEERRRVLPDVVHRAGRAHPVGDALDGRADQARLW